ncbi:unnamed protein product [Notodromas monacha]|uniref:Ig-like domain-containing protein n=1 Tax=Notodromas monacha TaxID=399045 RepID=A0A7R9BDP3_9CRUS|nr:unnamed protein product [Notodromas monacha]CAG0912257.1 unnamed protein product [Notodromas monacha]
MKLENFTWFLEKQSCLITMINNLSPKSEVHAGQPVKITELVVPSVVKNGSVDSVVLDCVYEFDVSNLEGLVVTWYFEDLHRPVYQWIPPNKPQDLGKFKDRLDLNYTASSDPNEKYRALRILNPTTDLHGEYSCRVSTFDAEDARSATMIVYAPATSFNFSHSKPSMDSVNVSCTAGGIYPRPTLSIYRYPNKRNRSEYKLENIKWTEERTQNGAYEISLSSLVEDQSLRQESMFECELLIPGTGYILKRKMVYFHTSARPVLVHLASKLEVGMQSYFPPGGVR